MLLFASDGGRALERPHFPSTGVNFKEDAQKCDARELAVTNVNQTWPPVSSGNTQVCTMMILKTVFQHYG